jgi:hypothetical protein
MKISVCEMHNLSSAGSITISCKALNRSGRAAHTCFEFVSSKNVRNSLEKRHIRLSKKCALDITSGTTTEKQNHHIFILVLPVTGCIWTDDHSIDKFRNARGCVASQRRAWLVTVHESFPHNQLLFNRKVKRRTAFRIITL